MKVHLGRERAFYVKQRYLTDLIVPLMVQRGDKNALYLIKNELQPWSINMEYRVGDTITWFNKPITCTVPHSTGKHPDWTPLITPEYWHFW